jgi:hypothetical protein
MSRRTALGVALAWLAAAGGCAPLDDARPLPPAAARYYPGADHRDAAEATLRALAAPSPGAGATAGGGAAPAAVAPWSHRAAVLDPPL